MEKLLIALCILFTISCNLSKEVEIDLPAFNEQPVVEGFLIPGEKFKMLISKSKNYFDPFQFEDPVSYYLSFALSDADVKIIVGQDTITLKEEIYLDTINQKIYNYISDRLVPNDFSSSFDLLITLKNGKQIFSSTKIPDLVPIDSSVIEWFDDRKLTARELIYHRDNINTKDFYRRMIHTNSLSNLSEQDYVLDDALFDQERVVYGTSYDFKDSTTLINSLVHITEDYYLYKESVDNAISANLNPFSQPGLIKSNLQGTANAIGIFTGMSIFRDSISINK